MTESKAICYKKKHCCCTTVPYSLNKHPLCAEEKVFLNDINTAPYFFGLKDGFIISIYGSLPSYLIDREGMDGHAREEFSKVNSYITFIRFLLWCLLVHYRQNNGWWKEWWACDCDSRRGSFQHRATEMSVKVQKLRENTDGLGHGPFHHDGLFLSSVLWLGYLAEVDTAAFSTDPCFGWPPLHCLAAIQVVWVRVRRHHRSWEGQGKKSGRVEETKRRRTLCKYWAGNNWKKIAMWLTMKCHFLILLLNGICLYFNFICTQAVFLNKWRKYSRYFY